MGSRGFVTDGAARAEIKLAYAMPSKEEEDDSQIPADKIVKTITKTKTKTE